MSGFYNTATGKASDAGFISGFFNTGIPTGSSPGTSGALSGLANMGTLIEGFFNLNPLAHISV